MAHYPADSGNKLRYPLPPISLQPILPTLMMLNALSTARRFREEVPPAGRCLMSHIASAAWV